MPRAVGTGRRGRRGAGGRAPPPLSAARPLPFLLDASQAGPFRGTCGPPPLPAGKRSSALAAMRTRAGFWAPGRGLRRPASAGMSARGGPRARRRQGPRLARPGGQNEARAGAPCWRDTPAASVTRETRARDPGPGAAAPSRDVPPAPALGPTSPDVWPQRWHLGGVQPHPPSGGGTPGGLVSNQ